MKLVAVALLWFGIEVVAAAILYIPWLSIISVALAAG